MQNNFNNIYDNNNIDNVIPNKRVDGTQSTTAPQIHSLQQSLSQPPAGNSHTFYADSEQKIRDSDQKLREHLLNCLKNKNLVLPDNPDNLSNKKINEFVYASNYDVFSELSTLYTAGYSDSVLNDNIFKFKLAVILKMAKDDESLDAVMSFLLEHKDKIIQMYSDEIRDLLFKQENRYKTLQYDVLYKATNKLPNEIKNLIWDLVKSD